MGWLPTAVRPANAPQARVAAGGLSHRPPPDAGGRATSPLTPPGGAGHRPGAPAVHAAGDWGEWRMALCHGILCLAGFSDAQAGGRTRWPDPDAVSEWGVAPRPGHRQSGQSAYPGDGDCDRLGLATLPAGQCA